MTHWNVEWNVTRKESQSHVSSLWASCFLLDFILTFSQLQKSTLFSFIFQMLQWNAACRLHVSPYELPIPFPQFISQPFRSFIMAANQSSSISLALQSLLKSAIQDYFLMQMFKLIVERSLQVLSWQNNVIRPPAWAFKIWLWLIHRDTQQVLQSPQTIFISSYRTWNRNRNIEMV